MFSKTIFITTIRISRYRPDVAWDGINLINSFVFSPSTPPRLTKRSGMMMMTAKIKNHLEDVCGLKVFLDTNSLHSILLFQDRLMLSMRLTYVKTCLGAKCQCFQTIFVLSFPPHISFTSLHKTLSYLTQQSNLLFVEGEEEEDRRSALQNLSTGGHVSSHFSFKLKLLK